MNKEGKLLGMNHSENTNEYGFEDALVHHPQQYTRSFAEPKVCLSFLRVLSDYAAASLTLATRTS